MIKKELTGEEVAKLVEHPPLLPFKRKNEPRLARSLKDEPEDSDSLKSTEELLLTKKRNLPLPELSRERKKMSARMQGESRGSGFVEREVRQQDIIALKSANNQLTSENVRLKTRNAQLEREIERLERSEEGKGKPRTDLQLLRVALRGKEKEIEELRKELAKVKTSVKFTVIGEWECERGEMLAEGARLRAMLEEERSRQQLSARNNGSSQASAGEQRVSLLEKRNLVLVKENQQLKSQLQPDEQKSQQESTSSKSLNKMLLSARKALREKDREINSLRGELGGKGASRPESLKEVENSQKSQEHRRGVRSARGSKEKRVVSRSAQKYQPVTHSDKQLECQDCADLKRKNQELLKELGDLKQEVENASAVQAELQAKVASQPDSPVKIAEQPQSDPPERQGVRRGEVRLPTGEEVNTVRRFIQYRMKAHHVTVQEAVFHLLGVGAEAPATVPVRQVIEAGMAEPFSLLTDRYVEAFVARVCFPPLLDPDSAETHFQIVPTQVLPRKAVELAFRELVEPFELIPQQAEEQLFIQVAELVTQYQPQIMQGLSSRRNGDRTVSEAEFRGFFGEISLQPAYVEFMLCQIVLESLDLDHLNFHTLFEVFFMPPEPRRKPIPLTVSIVQQADEELEESYSFVQQDLAAEVGKKVRSQEAVYESVMEAEGGHDGFADEAGGQMAVAEVMEVVDAVDEEYPEDEG